jgi:hypothetical protein
MSKPWIKLQVTKAMLDKWRLSNAKIGMNVSNFFTLSNYIGTDPETQTAFGYPNTRMYSLALEIGL